MAKDDYSVIMYKVLLYLYACKKRKIVFDERDFLIAAGADKINREYFNDVLRMMQNDGMITGLAFHRPWQATWIMVGEIGNAEITSAGIEHLTENSKMAKVKDVLLESADIVANLIGVAGLR